MNPSHFDNAIQQSMFEARLQVSMRISDEQLRQHAERLATQEEAEDRRQRAEELGRDRSHN
jgi:hypothetical protein